LASCIRWSGVLAALEATFLAEAIRRSVWAYPLLETVHIASIGGAVGSVLLLELARLRPGARDGVVAAGAARPGTALASFACAVASGSLLFVSAATEGAENPAFRAKLVLILIAGLNAVVFHARGGPARA